MPAVVAHAEVEREALRNAPVVLNEEVGVRGDEIQHCPRGDVGRRGVAEQEIGEGVAGVLTVEAEDPAAPRVRRYWRAASTFF